jgi:multiple sugar transport system ATP-binding protein
LYIEDGEFFTFLGPSGCGKTTTLNMIAGILEPDEGEIMIGERKIFSKKENIFVEPKDRNISMLFQEFSVYPNITIRESLSLPLKAKRINKNLIEKSVGEIAEITGVKKLLDRYPSTLSGGEKRRAGLAKALVKKCDVYLLDEPLTGCDAKMRGQLRGEIKRIHNQLGGTIINVTHDQVEAMCMSSRIMVINNGEKVQVDTPDGLYYRPNCIFTASFIGSPPMNLIRCSVKEIGGQLKFVRKEFKLPVPSAMTPKFKQYVGKKVVIGIRPNGISEKTSTEKTSRDYAFKGKIVLVETSQPSLLIHVKKGDLSLLIEAEELREGIGRETIFEFDPQKIHVFDQESGKAIQNAL